MILNLLRNGLGSILVFADWATRPGKLQRSPQQQAEVEAELKNMRLYQFYACPFCIKTRRVLHKLNLPMETRNVNEGSPYRAELEQGGGTIQVPCLYINEDGREIWMYESSEIIAYLEQRFLPDDDE